MSNIGCFPAGSPAGSKPFARPFLMQWTFSNISLSLRQGLIYESSAAGYSTYTPHAKDRYMGSFGRQEGITDHGIAGLF
jgi:hypothetical protein